MTGGELGCSTRARTATASVLSAVFMLTIGTDGANAQPATSEQKRRVDQRLQDAEDRLGSARRREAVLTSQVRSYSTRIRSVTVRLRPLEAQLALLQADVAELEGRLWRLESSLRRAREAFNVAETHLVARQGALAVRLREIYVRGEPDSLLAILHAGSIADALSTSELLKRIGERDARLVATTRVLVDRSRRRRGEIQSLRDRTLVAERRAETAADRLRATTEELTQRRDELERARRRRDSLLARASGQRSSIEAETQDLRRRSERLAARIVRAQAGSAVVLDPSISSQGMIYPVNGALTSSFGPRWGRMHEGLDIAVPTGTPVAAAAPGVVLSAGWAGGYGNLVVIDHGGGVATAYAHNSSVSVSAGQRIARGAIVALAGSTGRSTGPHVHFEVRVNGVATDPIAYL